MAKGIKKLEKQIKEAKKEISQLKENSESKKEGDAESKLKREIQDLESRKQDFKGFKGFFMKAGINKEINMRKRHLQNINLLPALKKQAEVVKTATEVQKAKAELRELQRRNNVTFEDLSGLETKKKGINLGDLGL